MIGSSFRLGGFFELRRERFLIQSVVVQRTMPLEGRLGNQKAVTAMAHKLARVLWHLLKFKQAFDGKVFEKEEARMKRKKLVRLQNMAASLNLQLVPLQ